jgi:predicted cupin superfamily sugar epimerase
MYPASPFENRLVNVTPAGALIAELDLRAHPEGGFFRETHRSADVVTTARGPRNALTSILFLLTQASFSAFHRIASDEAWHFYRGDPIAIEILHSSGEHECRVLSEQGPWQTVVPAGAAFASHVKTRHGEAPGYALVGCDVAPGFDFADFELCARDSLTAAHPRHADLIAGLTRQ